MPNYLFPNPDGNFWIDKYNSLVTDIRTGKRVFSTSDVKEVVTKSGKIRHVGLGTHHVIPKSIRPDLLKDPGNLISLPFKDHMDLHYFLWKADPKYGKQLWFGCVFGRKHHLWDLPGGESEYEELKRSLKRIKMVSNSNLI